MKALITTAVCASILVAVPCFAGTPGSGQDKAGNAVSAPGPAGTWASDPVLVKLTAFYSNTTDFQAGFKQVVNTRSPKRTFKRTGKVYFKRPGMMRWDYSVPDAVFYVSDGTVLWVYDQEEGAAIKMKVADSELYSALGFLSGTSKLSESFNPEVQAAGRDGVPVKLVPKTANGNFRSLTVVVNPTTGEVVETEVEDPMGNKSRIRFESPKYDKVPASGFDFKVPKGVRVQDLTSGVVPAPTGGAVPGGAR